MIGVAIPAHNEAELIGACLRAVQSAATHAGLGGEEVVVAVALDRCNDTTSEIAEQLGVTTLALACGNVGLAREAATRELLARGARWIASTDADTLVPQHWLSAQLALDCDVFLGIVQVEDWHGYHPRLPAAFEGSELACVGHPHVHGANMGFRADSFLRSGGYRAHATSEDVALVHAFVETGAHILRLPAPTVITSSRRTARAAGGFSDYLREMNRLLWLDDGLDPALGGSS